MSNIESDSHEGNTEGMSNDRIAVALERLTRAESGEPALFRKALEQERPATAPRLLLRRPMVRMGMAAGLLLCVGLAGSVWWRSTQGEARGGNTAPYAYRNVYKSLAAPSEAPADADSEPRHKSVDRSETWKQYGSGNSGAGSADSPAATGRQVVHKAMMDLQTADVRSTYLKAMLLVSEASGEYVQDSALAGGDPPVSANLTLRVTAARLPTVLQQLRDLGKVLTESANGEDVTDRMVDLAAQIRNEERVEKELLDLLEKRTDSALKDVLEVREQLAKVRGRIEQLRGQQAAAQKSVAYATVLVTLRAQPEAPKPPAPEAGFIDRLGLAANDGLHSAGDSLLWLARTATAGLPWWTALTLAGIGALALRRRLHRQAARERAPAV